MKSARSPRRGARVLRGLAASPGVAVGPVRRVEDLSPVAEERELAPGEVDAEAGRFRSALIAARDELSELRAATARELGDDEARIFDVQLMVLEDPLVIDRTVEAIRAERRNAEYLFRRHVLEISEQLEGLANAYLSDRAIDLRDVTRRVLRHLAGDSETAAGDRAAVLIGREIAPSDAVHLDPGRVLGFATELGGPTSHAAIMARARGIPAVVGVRGLAELARDGDTVAVDGLTGKVHLNPTATVLSDLKARRREFARIEKRRERLLELPAETRDGVAVQLAANMEIPEELDYIRSRGADGIGLFRTEFFFMLGQRSPSEDEQYRVYRRVAESIEGGVAVIRVLDVGGDKFASYLGLRPERNPFLGMRGVRYLLAHPDVLATQLRAILRAGVHGRLRILIPMVSSVDEMDVVRRYVDEALATLRTRRVPHDRRPEIGAMIEVPSAVLMADAIARRSDFLSIGSNDLIQYTLAVERDHEVLHDLYQPLHPAILRSIERVVVAGHRRGIPVAVCGEMAADPRALPVLIGLGIDRLSVSPYLLPEVKQIVRSVEAAACRSLAADALNCLRTADVERLVRTRLGSEYTDVLQLARGRAPRRAGEGRARKPRGREDAS